MKIISLLLLLILPFRLCGQADSPDKFSLLTTPYNKRPLTLYKGQLMFNAGYKIALRSRSFDNNGEVINLKENGNSSVLHNYFFAVRYGILDFFEAGIEDNYMSHAVRSESTTYSSLIGNITYNTLTEFTGMGDLYLYGSLRLPGEFKSYDLSLSGGVYLPTGAHKPGQPEHSLSDYQDEYSYTVNYHYLNTNGTGVPQWQVAGSGKLLFSKFAAEASVAYRVPFSEGTNVRWDHVLTGKVFTYSGTNYAYIPDETVSARAGIFFQPNGWFNVHIASEYIKNLNGWTEYYGLKYRNPEVDLVTIVPGFEIQISPSVRITQLAGFTLSGRNSDAPFFMVTALTYNLMPFSK